MQVMLESQAQLALAERFLHAMRAAYPEVLASIRTKQVAQEMLHFKAEYIAELCSSGDWRCYKQPACWTSWPSRSEHNAQGPEHQ